MPLLHAVARSKTIITIAPALINIPNKSDKIPFDLLSKKPVAIRAIKILLRSNVIVNTSQNISANHSVAQNSNIGYLPGLRNLNLDLI